MPIYDLREKKDSSERSRTNWGLEKGRTRMGRPETGDWRLQRLLLQIHNYARLMSLLKLQQHVAREMQMHRPTSGTSKTFCRLRLPLAAFCRNDRHIILTHISQICWQRAQIGVRGIKSGLLLSTDICPIITTDSSGFQLLRYIWLCLVKQITTTNKLHSNQSWSMPTKGSRQIEMQHSSPFFIYIFFLTEPSEKSIGEKDTITSQTWEVYTKLLFKFTATGNERRQLGIEKR